MTVYSSRIPGRPPLRAAQAGRGMFVLNDPGRAQDSSQVTEIIQFA
jgi:hypothetical protein